MGPVVEAVVGSVVESVVGAVVRVGVANVHKHRVIEVYHAIPRDALAKPREISKDNEKLTQ